MNSISIEFLPFIFWDIIYIAHRSGSIQVLSVHFNGSPLYLTDEQKKSIISEIKYIIEEDFNNDMNENEFLHEN
jgi:hypothetical protein